MPDAVEISAAATESADRRRRRLKWKTLATPVLLAIVGMMMAWAAASLGQAARRQNDATAHDLAVTQSRLALRDAEAAGEAPEKIAALQKALDENENLPLPAYDQPGREFTEWDGFRYEEIAEKGYIFHQPGDSEQVKDSPTILPAGASEPRLKNVSWYPLYPMLGWLLAHAIGISINHALTAVSWVCSGLAAAVAFLFLRRFFIARSASLSDGVVAADSAALWGVVCLVVGPCSIFLYANFTEGLFTLLLAAFLYCVQERWWWRAALVAAVASASRSQGVLFGPILALVFLVRSSKPAGARLIVACGLGAVSAAGIMAYAVYLQVRFGDALAFMRAQQYWNVGISGSRLAYAANPWHAIHDVAGYALSVRPMDWPRFWEALCTLWPPVILLLGWRRLSLELAIVGWLMWILPYVSNCMAGNPPLDSQWMSMGRFMAVMIPAYAIAGITLARRPWFGIAFAVVWATCFALFCYTFGTGAWVG